MRTKQKNNTLSPFIFVLVLYVLITNLLLYLLIYLQPTPIDILLVLFTLITIILSIFIFRIWKTKISNELLSEIEFNQSLVEQSPVFFVAIDPSGNTLYMNNRMLKALGYNECEIKGTNYASTFVPEEDREALVKVFARIVNQNENIIHINRIISKKGKTIDCEWHGIPIFDGRGKNFFVGVGIDITERLISESEIEKYKTHLESIVEERTSALKIKSDQLEAINKELEFFSYSVTHDLRAPLRGINGWSLALMEDYGTFLDEKAQKYIERVLNEAQRMEVLIDNLLKLAKITLAEMTSNEVDLSKLASNVASRLQEENPERQISFVIEPDLLANGDQHFLEILLTNLISNSVKFTSKKKETKIEFGKTSANDESVYFVRDNGVGFDMKYADKIFCSFQRLHNQNEFPGSGVGLAIVKRIVNLHAGQLWAESELNQGAVFYFTLNKN